MHAQEQPCLEDRRSCVRRGKPGCRDAAPPRTHVPAHSHVRAPARAGLRAHTRARRVGIGARAPASSSSSSSPGSRVGARHGAAPARSRLVGCPRRSGALPRRFPHPRRPGLPPRAGRCGAARSPRAPPVAAVAAATFPRAEASRSRSGRERTDGEAAAPRTGAHRCVLGGAARLGRGLALHEPRSFPLPPESWRADRPFRRPDSGCVEENPAPFPPFPGAFFWGAGWRSWGWRLAGAGCVRSDARARACARILFLIDSAERENQDRENHPPQAGSLPA